MRSRREIGGHGLFLKLLEPLSSLVIHQPVPTSLMAIETGSPCEIPSWQPEMFVAS
jgi:hypothetical protein